MACSTRIRTDAILLVVIHSCSVSFPVSFIMGGIFNWTPGGKISSNEKPLSAITLSPGSSSFKNPDFTTIFLSDMLPPYKSDIKEIAPDGVMPMSALKCYGFYSLKMFSCWAVGFDGIWMNISMASIIHLVLGYMVRKQAGIYSSTSSRHGHGTSLSFMKRRLIHVMRILETEGCDIWNLTAKSCTGKPCQSRHNVIKNQFMGDRI